LTSEFGLSDRSPGIFVLIGGILVSAAAVATPYAATGITLRVVRPTFLEGPRTIPALSEPQMANRMTKGNRVALLRDSPSYANFDSSSLELGLSRLPTRENVNGLLSDAQIAAIENRLRLSSQQAQYWPSVAVALRGIGRRYFQTPNRARSIPLNSSEVKQLVEAAVPLIAQLSEDQKREARQLLRIIGLEKVASGI
jgi:hypothetical protein